MAASLSFTIIPFSFLCLLLVISPAPASSLTCTSQKFTNKLFANCTDLPQLNSYLHWTYDPSNSSLSIAFIARPASPSGWIAWAINPTGSGMVGAQALVAYETEVSVAIKTFNLISHSSVVESKLSFDVWDVSGEINDGVMTIFATVKVPEKAESVNQVWQVGASVTQAGVPEKHESAPANLNSKEVLQLVGKTWTAAPAPGSGVSRIGVGNLGLKFGTFVFVFFGCLMVRW